MPKSLCLLLALGLTFQVLPQPTEAAPEQPVADQPAATAEQEADFETHIRPILVARCFECHGESKQEGGLRLDSRAAATRDGDAGPAVIPGKPEVSRLIEVIRYADAIRMPPGGKLPEEEIARLTEWIQRGAFYPADGPSAEQALGRRATPEGIAEARRSHWAFQPLARRAPPALSDEVGNGTDTLPTDIDRYLLDRLDAAGLSFGPRVDRRTLLRRVSFDLIGLPPTAAEVSAFEADSSPDAWARFVDRLLDSPHYGERWGRHWLDVARYADTKGYVFTEERKYPFSYTYRDYVIRAFNQDLPFDRFVIEQLAADQLPLGEDRTPLAAMGFLTLGRRFGNNQNDIIDDRIDVVTRGLLGMTVGCARCHDHKYDPIPTADYYSLYGVFASSTEPGDLPQIGPAIDGEAYRAYEAELQNRESVLEAFLVEKLAALADELREKTPEYLAAVVRLAGQDLPDDRGRSLGRGEVRMPVVRRWRNYIAETAKAPHAVFGPWHALAQLPGERFAEQAATVIAALSDAPDAQPRANPLVRRALQEAPPRSMDDVAGVYGKLLKDAHEQWVRARQSAAVANAPTDSAVSVLADPAAEELRQVLYAEGNPTAVSREESRRLFDRATRNKVSELRRAIDSHKANSPAAPPRAMVLADVPEPVEPHVFLRGNQGRPGPQVPRRFLQVLSPADAPPFRQGSGRMELARAIAHPDNPLTARVFVNRVWMQHFGRGLVATPSDFGYRGEPPSHPELLDHLAASFMDDGWSVKRLHRRILLSAAYQQSSDDRPDGRRIDPENRLLWRMNRRRLEFEPLRDSLLAVAGRLDTTAGGRPVDLFASPFTTRRAVYGFIDRQDLPGTLRVFDFASPDVSTPQRPQTTVPQQALFAMNSPFVVEQAQGLAARPDIEGAATSAEQVRALYRWALARHPAEEELAAAVAFLTGPQPAADEIAGTWRYGYGEYDESATRLLSFTPLPHFQDQAWRGGPRHPDVTLGWTMLTAEGGHPGGTPQLAVVRRWTAPRAGSITVAATLAHAAEQGDGVRGRIVSSRAGELGLWSCHHGTVETKVDRVEVVAGETIDFVVDCLSNEAHDAFTWPPVIVMASAAGSPQQWIAPAEFRGPDASGLSPLVQLAQALLLTNEFVFVD